MKGYLTAANEFDIYYQRRRVEIARFVGKIRRSPLWAPSDGTKGFVDL